MRTCTSAAPASLSMPTIWPQVVPRTMESSIITTRLPSTASRRGFSLTRTLDTRLFWPGLMKVRPT